ncbi:hypothetical protein BMS3Bbin04_01131 [bacterium BMS3Bbin04]|nr:hypothetical protein BMS3Bbin04_01131 [bacterium BMS3Bbin04]
MDLEGISYEAKDFFEAGSQVMSHADSVLMTPEFTAWITDLNLAVGNIEAITTELLAQQMPDRLDSMLGELQFASVEAREGAEHLNSALGILSNDVEQLQLSRRADSLFADINRTFDQTSALMGQSQYSISQVVAQLSISVTELNSTLQQVNALLLSFEEYPSRVLYSAPPEKEE